MHPDQIKAQLVATKREAVEAELNELAQAKREEVAQYEASLTPDVLVATVEAEIAEVEAEIVAAQASLDPMYEKKRSLENVRNELISAQAPVEVVAVEEAPVA